MPLFFYRNQKGADKIEYSKPSLVAMAHARTIATFFVAKNQIRMEVANITEDIRNENTGYLNDFLNAVISEGVREGITDIFGQGVEIDDSEVVQTARRAKELLDKLAEYKPLAKIEELEEQNYNMIDNVLNNGAEKKAVIEQRDKAERTSPEKETEKKSQREM